MQGGQGGKVRIFYVHILESLSKFQYTPRQDSQGALIMNSHALLK